MLSLNLTNLVILVVLKALILAAGFFGAGAWKGGHGYGRSLEGELIVFLCISRKYFYNFLIIFFFYKVHLLSDYSITTHNQVSNYLFDCP